MTRLPLLIAVLSLTLTGLFACQASSPPGDTMVPSTVRTRTAKKILPKSSILAKKGSLLVVYTSNNDGEIDPCG